MLDKTTFRWQGDQVDAKYSWSESCWTSIGDRRSVRFEICLQKAMSGEEEKEDWEGEEKKMKIKGLRAATEDQTRQPLTSTLASAKSKKGSRFRSKPDELVS